MENKEMKKEELKVKKQNTEVENYKEMSNVVYNFEENEEKDLRKVIKETIAKIVKKQRRNGEEYYVFSVALSDSLIKEFYPEPAELELMRMARVNEVPAKFVEAVGRNSGKVYFRLYVDIDEEYTKFVDFSYAEHVVLKKILI